MRPLVEKFDISVILIHHNRKSTGESYDEMDELRGSSDLANYADIILKMERKSGNVILKQLKNRNAKEIEPIKINCRFEEGLVTMEYAGEYLRQTLSEQFSEKTIIWIEENNITEFKTSDIRELALKHGAKKNTIHNALINLQDRGIIKSIGRGCYQVVEI